MSVSKILKIKVVCEQSTFSAVTEHGIRRELAKILDSSSVENCLEQVQGLLASLRSALRDSAVPESSVTY
jgi:hypothetical protein